MMQIRESMREEENLDKIGHSEAVAALAIMRTILRFSWDNGK